MKSKITQFLGFFLTLLGVVMLLGESLILNQFFKDLNLGHKVIFFGGISATVLGTIMLIIWLYYKLFKNEELSKEYLDKLQQRNKL